MDMGALFAVHGVTITMAGLLWAAGAIAALTAAGTAIWKTVGKPSHRLFQGISEFIKDWQGHPARPEVGQDRVPGVPEQIYLVKSALEASVERLTAVEAQTRQLEFNTGTHLRDDVAKTLAVVQTYVQTWEEQQAALRTELLEERAHVKAALDAQAEAVHAQLVAHTGEIDTELKKVWREFATRDIHRSVDVLTEAADRAEQAAIQAPRE